METLISELRSFAFEKVSQKGRSGVTTFYRNYFRRKPFKSPVKYPKRKGLQIGRITDLNLREYCKNGQLPRRTEIGKYMHHIHAACKMHGLKMVRAQVPVGAGPIHTQLDGLAVTKSGEIAVIELKCTQQNRAEHKTNYRTACTNAPTLRVSGLVNNEYNAHQWQCGFGVVAFRRTYPQFSEHRIVGCVIVVCDDGAMLYRTTSEPSIDDLPTVAVSEPADPPPELSMFLKSSFEGGGPLIDALIVKSGFTGIKKTGNLLTAMAHDQTRCLFGIMPAFSRVTNDKRRTAVAALKKARSPKGGQRAFVVHRTSKGWELALVGKRTKVDKKTR